MTPAFVEMRKLVEDALSDISGQGSSNAERERCRQDAVYFINTYCKTYDPRNIDNPFIPFHLFDKQKEFIRWLDEREKKKESGLAEKSRDTGMSFMSCAWAVHRWLFKPGYKIGFGSYKLKYVDKLGDMDSLLEKIRFIIRQLPDFLKPKGFKEGVHDCQFKILNPQNGAAITGEVGDDIGRGGRAQPLDAKLLTPHGWVTMADAYVGMTIIGRNGLPTTVTGVFPQGFKPVYKVSFNDGSSTECCADHLWQVSTLAARKGLKRRKVSVRKNGVIQSLRKDSKPPFEVLDLKSIEKIYRKNRPEGWEEFPVQIPLVSPVDFGTGEKLLIDPYVMGALLGDGSTANLDHTSPSFTTADEEMVGLLERQLPGYKLVPSGNYGYRIARQDLHKGRGYHSPLKRNLKVLGLNGRKSHEKFIPKPYLFSSPENRLEVLRGLMDTDGWVARCNKAVYSTTSSTLVENVKFLVQSLGGTTSVHFRKGKRTIFPQGRAYDCRDNYSVEIKLPNNLNPFRLTRKAAKYTGRTRYQPRRNIVNIEEVGVKECQCIAVDAPDGLYLTDDCIVTHNTSIYFVDESARIEHPEQANMALSATTNVRIDISTPNGPGNPFAIKRFSGSVPVFTYHWRDDPRKNEEWAEIKRKEIGLTAFASEYDIDYSSSIDFITIPGVWVRAAVDLKLPDSMFTFAGLDIAEAGDDDCVFVARRGPVVKYIEAWGKHTTFQTAHKAKNLCVQWGVKELNFDADGVGAGVTGDLQSMADELPFYCRGIHSGGATTETYWPDNLTAKEKFANLKAELWWTLRRRFERTFEYVTQGIPHEMEDLISIPNNPELITQLSLPLYEVVENGKIRIESKKKMRERGVSSPDYADALVYSEASYVLKQKKLWIG
jgi:hypothetical protein